MNEQRREVLQLLAEGKITADEAEQLIAALERDEPDSAASGSEARPKPRLKYLRVVVDATDHAGGDGPTRVNVRVPLTLLRAGVKLASLIPPKALNHANDELRKAGIPVDLTQLKPDQLETLAEHLHDVTVEVDQPDAKVHVFCE